MFVKFFVVVVVLSPLLQWWDSAHALKAFFFFVKCVELRLKKVSSVWWKALERPQHSPGVTVNKFKFISIEQSHSKPQWATVQSECRRQRAKGVEHRFKFITPCQLTCNYIWTTQWCHHDITAKKRSVLLSARRRILCLSLSLLYLDPNFSILLPVSTNDSKTLPLTHSSCGHGDDRPVLLVQPAPQTQLHRTICCTLLSHL